MSRRLPCLTLLLVIGFAISSDSSCADDAHQAIRKAIEKALPLIQKGAAGSAKERTCFTCHSQAVPILALAEAQEFGFDVDAEILKKQLKHTSAHLKRGQKNYLAGKGQGGKVLTAGYALWALDKGDYKPDEITAAVTGFLAKYQEKKVYWFQNSRRHPSAGSPFANTFVALRALAKFNTDEQAKSSQARIKKVREWLIKEQPKNSEDRAFRIRALKIADAPQKELQNAIDDLLKHQQSDGGWAQTAEMETDAYATSTALVALLSDGDLNGESPAVIKAKDYLLRTQNRDGSWHVKTRAKGFQTYFETGFPHGKDQFISIAASSWATIALMKTLPSDQKGE